MVFPSAGTIEKMLIAFAFALAGTFLFMKILDRLKFKDTIFIPLVGLMFGNVISSVTTFLPTRMILFKIFPHGCKAASRLS